MTVDGAPLRIAVLCPHFAPDTAPTGVVMTRIVTELAALGHELHVVTALPWYRHHAIEPGWDGKLGAARDDGVGIDHPGQPVPRRRQAQPRSAGPPGSSASARSPALARCAAGESTRVIAMSPPLTLGLTGWVTHLVRRGPLVFNIQDVFPDAAVADRRDHQPCGSSPSHVAGAGQLPPRRRGHRALRRPARQRRRQGAGRRSGAACTSSPTSSTPSCIRPLDRMTAYRARARHRRRDRRAVRRQRRLLAVAGDGRRRGPSAARRDVRDQRRRRGPTVAARSAPRAWPTSASPATSRRSGCRRCWPPATSTSCRCGAGSAASACRRRRTRSSPPGGRCWPRSTRAPRCRASSPQSGGGVAVPPDDPVAFIAALARPRRRRRAPAAMGAAGRRWVEHAASPAAVAEAYADLIDELNRASVTQFRGRGGDSLASSWLRHHPPKRSPSSPRVARARGFASRAARFSHRRRARGRARVCWPSSTAGRAGHPMAPACPGQRRHQHRRHWHTAYGIYVCDTFQPKLTGTKEETGSTPTATGATSTTSSASSACTATATASSTTTRTRRRSSGNRAKLGVFLDVYDVKLTDTELVLPADQGGDKWSTNDTKCDGKDTQLKVACGTTTASPASSTTSSPTSTTSASPTTAWSWSSPSCRRTPTSRCPSGPPSCPTLGAADGGAVIPSTTTLAPGATGDDDRRRVHHVEHGDRRHDGTAAAPRPTDHRRRPRPALRHRPRPPPAADARRRPGRRVRHPPAPAHADHPEADAPGRSRADHRAARRQPGQGRRHRRHAGARLQAGAVRRGVPER